MFQLTNLGATVYTWGCVCDGGDDGVGIAGGGVCDGDSGAVYMGDVGIEEYTSVGTLPSGDSGMKDVVGGDGYSGVGIQSSGDGLYEVYPL